MNPIEIILGLKTKPLETGFAQAKKYANEFKKELMTPIKSGLGGILAAFSFDAILEKASTIAATSKKFGETAENIQRLGAAAKKVDLDMETAAKGGFKAFVEAQKALTGNETAQKSFAALGITLEQLATLKGPADTILLLADAVYNATDKHVALAAAADLVGVRQAGLLQLFLQGRQRIEEYGAAATVMSDETVESLEKIEKTLARVKSTVQNSFGNLLVTLKDPIQFLLFGFEQLAFLVSSFLRQIGSFKNGGLSGLREEVAKLNKEWDTMMTRQTKVAVAGMSEKERRQELAKLTVQGTRDGELSGLKLIQYKVLSNYKPEDEKPSGLTGEINAGGGAGLDRKAEQLADLQAANARKALSDADRLNSLLSDRDALLKDAAAIEAKTGDDAMTIASNQAAAIDKRIAAERLNGEIIAEQNRLKQEAARNAQEEARDAERMADAQRGLVYSQLNDEQKIVALRERQNQLLREAVQLDQSGDRKGATDRRIEALKAEEEQSALIKSTEEKRKQLADVIERGQMEEMSPAEQRAYLQKKLQDQIDQRDKTSPLDDNAILDQSLAIERTRDQLRGLTRRTEVPVDSLRAIGGSLAGVNYGGADTLKQTNDYLKEIRDFTRRTAEQNDPTSVDNTSAFDLS